MIRLLSGTQFFLVRYSGPGVLALSKNHSGQLQKIPLGANPITGDVIVQSDSFVFCEPGVSIKGASDLSSNFFQTQRALGSFFALRFQGKGALFAMGFGDVREVALGIGERLITAPGKVMAFDRCVQVDRFRHPELSRVLSGESERIRIQGPGRVWLQSRDRRRDPRVVIRERQRPKAPRKPPRVEDDDILEKWIWDPR